MPSAPRVLIADDSTELRDVVRSQLERAGIIVVAEAADGDAALDAAARLHPDVVVLDAAMPGAGVAALVARMADHKPPPAVVVYSGWPSAELADLGVALVAKSSDPAVLVAAVRLAAHDRPAT